MKLIARAKSLSKSPVCILMTAYGYDPTHSLVKARQDGLKHVLFKPFRVDQLRDALSGCTPAVPPPGERGA